MTKYSIKLAVLFLGFSFRDLFAVGREDSIKFGSVRRGRERLEWVRDTFTLTRDRLRDSWNLTSYRLGRAWFSLRICGKHCAWLMAKELHDCLTSHPPVEGWQSVEVTTPVKRRRAVAAAHTMTVSKPKRGKEKRVPSDRTLDKKTDDQLILLAQACGLTVMGHQGIRHSLLKRLRAKRTRQQRAS